MKRFDGIKNIMKYLEDEILICNIGFPSRELYEIKDRNKNFYMLGSMGLASSIGLGLAISKKEERVIIFDGDGSVLMNFGSLFTIFNQNPSNLILIVFDNGVYGSTGNQNSYAQNSDLLEIAKSIGFKRAYRYDEIDFEKILKEKSEDSIFIHYKVLPGNHNSKIIDLSPEKIKNRFMKSINRF